MGYNAGGYGTMTFRDAAAVAQWKKATVSHAAYEDWIDGLDSPYQPDETVTKRLVRVAKGHDPKSYAFQVITIDGNEVSLTFDTGEDWFRESVSDLAALLRSADAFGAKGTFYFLGTAGAEEDFAYELVLDGKKSKVSRLPRNRIHVAYGKDYEAFMQRVGAMFEAANPAMRKLMTTMREGVTVKKAGAKAHDAVASALAKFSDAELVKTVAKLPGLVPAGTGLGWPKDVYTAKTVRAQLTSPPNEETRAAALWTLGELAPDTAVPLAFAILDNPAKENEHVIAAALRVVRHAKGDDAKRALEEAAKYIQSSKSLHARSGAQAILLASKHESLDKHLAALLGKVHRSKIVLIAYVLEKRKRTALKDALARAFKRTRNASAKELLEKWKKK